MKEKEKRHLKITLAKPNSWGVIKDKSEGFIKNTNKISFLPFSKKVLTALAIFYP
jgi:hypothetical protein